MLEEKGGEQGTGAEEEVEDRTEGAETAGVGAEEAVAEENVEVEVEEEEGVDEEAPSSFFRGVRFGSATSPGITFVSWAPGFPRAFLFFLFFFFLFFAALD